MVNIGTYSIIYHSGRTDIMLLYNNILSSFIFRDFFHYVILFQLKVMARGACMLLRHIS